MVLRRLRRQSPERVVLAVPVCSPEAADLLSEEANDIVCLHQPRAFTAVGLWYEDFEQLSDDDVLEALHGQCAGAGQCIRRAGPPAPRCRSEARIRARRWRRERRIWDTPTGQPRPPGCFRPIRSGPVTLTDGTYWLGPSTGRLLIKTGRAGLGRRAGHDLTIEATQWSGEAMVAIADPARSWVNVTVETESLQVREGTGGLKPLTDADRAEIKRTLEDKTLLNAAEHPTITFRSTRIEGTPEAFEITGELTIKGRTHPVTVHGKGHGDGLLRGWATITQSTWGIKPYTAFLGALRLADDVRIEFDVTRLEPANGPR